MEKLTQDLASADHPGKRVLIEIADHCSSCRRCSRSLPGKITAFFCHLLVKISYCSLDRDLLSIKEAAAYHRVDPRTL